MDQVCFLLHIHYRKRITSWWPFFSRLLANEEGGRIDHEQEDMSLIECCQMEFLNPPRDEEYIRCTYLDDSGNVRLELQAGDECTIARGGGSSDHPGERVCGGGWRRPTISNGCRHENTSLHRMKCRNSRRLHQYFVPLKDSAQA